jgi:hypothetical protein
LILFVVKACGSVELTFWILRISWPDLTAALYTQTNPKNDLFCRFIQQENYKTCRKIKSHFMPTNIFIWVLIIIGDSCEC